MAFLIACAPCFSWQETRKQLKSLDRLGIGLSLLEELREEADNESNDGPNEMDASTQDGEADDKGDSLNTSNESGASKQESSMSEAFILDQGEFTILASVVVKWWCSISPCL